MKVSDHQPNTNMLNTTDTRYVTDDAEKDLTKTHARNEGLHNASYKTHVPDAEAAWSE